MKKKRELYKPAGFSRVQKKNAIESDMLSTLA